MVIQQIFVQSRWPPFSNLSKGRLHDEASSLGQFRVVEYLGSAVRRGLMQFESTKLSTCLEGEVGCTEGFEQFSEGVAIFPGAF